MDNFDGNILVAIIALVINLITIIKFTNHLENRLTKLETTIEVSISPNIEKLERMFEVIYLRGNEHRKDDIETFTKN